RFPTEVELQAFLPSIVRQDARDLIYGTALDTAIEDSVDLFESQLLDWLAKLWNVRVELDGDDPGARSRLTAPPPFERQPGRRHDAPFHVAAPRGRPQHRHHRPRRSRQDHAGRRDAAPDGRLPGQRAGGGARDGFERARA